MISELPFEDKISALCFANARADLLIGRSDQIILFKMQDYLPPSYLIESLRREIADDLQENMLNFDPTIEFWDYAQISDRRISNCSEKKWHFSSK